MKYYKDTDVEISYMVSCEICNNWWWSKKYNMFICPKCRDEAERRRREFLRKANGEKYELCEESIIQGAKLFSLVVENKLHGINEARLRKIAINRGYITYNMKQCIIHMERTGHLVWIDEFDNLRPYKNLNTGQEYQ